ncbi:MAG: DUF2179 domain-containing protein [Proteobacteria bacterium]|nr:DUF2179 domain-containing protein [Pseudomonadota bacterium]MBU4009216.1 DUF2179 domain-containing protein [Pseudomonadota bacterium]
MIDFHNAEFISWVVLPALVFFARVIDVSIGTLRIIYVSKGIKLLAALCGFFEVLVWLVAITQIMQNLSNWLIYVTYAAGFSSGNIIGIFLEEKLAVGYVALRIIAQKDATELVEHIREKNYGVTVVGASGLSGRVRLVFSIVKRKDIPELVKIIKKYNPKAFYSTEDVKMISNGTTGMSAKSIFGARYFLRK